MSTSSVQALGLAAGSLTTLSFLPQLFKTVQTRSAQDLSYGMLLVFAAGVFLWLVYGYFLRALPIMLANGVTFGLVVVIAVLKVYYEWPRTR